jgi:hypothetical protein
MGNYFSKQPSSRILKAQNITLTGKAASTPSTDFTAETFSNPRCDNAIRMVSHRRPQVGSHGSNWRHFHYDRSRRLFCCDARTTRSIHFDQYKHRQFQPNRDGVAAQPTSFIPRAIS